MRVIKTEMSGDKTSKVDKVERYAWKKPGKQGEFMWLNKVELFIDHSYQRDKIHNERILKMAAAWDWVMCGAISVAMRENDWYVMDGQHRVLAALKRSDIDQLPCMVFQLESQQHEALAFVGLNSQKTAVSGVDRFKAMVVAQDPIALGIRDMLAATGHKVHSSKASKNVACIMLIWNLYKRNSDVMKHIWPLISDASIGAPPVDSFVRALYGAELKAHQKGFSLIDIPVRTAIIMASAAGINAEIRRECAIAGKGGERVEASAFIKWLNRQRLGSKYKIEML